MVVGTAAVIAAAATGGAAVPAIAAGAGSALGTGTATAAGTAAAGTIASGTLIGSAVGTTGTFGSAGLLGASIASGPVGWIILGADPADLTFDCWKPLLHDKSVEPSNGILLRNVLSDARIKEIRVTDGTNPTFPAFQLRNIWNEDFAITYVCLPDGELAAHAVPVV